MLKIAAVLLQIPEEHQKLYSMSLNNGYEFLLL